MEENLTFEYVEIEKLKKTSRKLQRASSKTEETIKEYS